MATQEVSVLVLTVGRSHGYEYMATGRVIVDDEFDSAVLEALKCMDVDCTEPQCIFSSSRLATT